MADTLSKSNLEYQIGPSEDSRCSAQENSFYSETTPEIFTPWLPVQ